MKHIYIVEIVIYSIFLQCQYCSAGQYKLPNFNDQVTQLVSPSPNVIIIGSDNGLIWKAVNGVQNAQLKNSQFNGGRINCITFLNENIGYACADDRISKTVDGGETWTLQNAFTSSSVDLYDLYAFSENEIIVSGNATIYRTTNGGSSWTEFSAINNMQLRSVTFVNDVGIISGISFGPIIKTTNRGANWILGNYDNFGSYASTKVNDKLFLAGFLSNGSQFGVMVLSSTNFGATWQEASFPRNGGQFMDISFWGNYGYAVGYKTNSPIDSTRSYKTTDGINWQPFVIGEGRSRFETVLCANNTVYVGADHGWIYWEQIVGINQLSSIVPKEFLLKQNYPNPFNPATKIQFDISSKSNIELNVYNSIGKHVQTLLSQTINPGTYNYDFDATNLPSGIYYYKLSSENFSDTKKMIIVK